MRASGIRDDDYSRSQAYDAVHRLPANVRGHRAFDGRELLCESVEIEVNEFVFAVDIVA